MGFGVRCMDVLVVAPALLAWGKTRHLFSPWFPPVQNGNHNNAYFKGWLHELEKQRHIMCLMWSLT